MDTCQSKISSTPAKKVKKVKAPKKVKAKAEVKKMTAKDNYLNVGSKSPTKKPVKDDKKLVPTKGFKWTADNIFLFVAVLVIVFLLLAGLFLRKKSIVQQMGGAIIDLLELE